MKGEITKWLTEAYETGFFVYGNKCTPEVFEQRMKDNPTVSERVKTFMRHASKTAFINLSVPEVLTAQCKKSKLESFGCDHLQQRLLALPFRERLEKVMREARYWDQQYDYAQEDRALASGNTAFQ